MHSSRMPTARSLTISRSIPGRGSAHPPPDVYPPNAYPPGHVMHAVKPLLPQWTEGITHACENITFPQLLLRSVITQVSIFAVCDGEVL